MLSKGGRNVASLHPKPSPVQDNLLGPVGQGFCDHERGKLVGHDLFIAQNRKVEFPDDGVAQFMGQDMQQGVFGGAGQGVGFGQCGGKER